MPAGENLPQKIYYDPRFVLSYLGPKKNGHLFNR
jgi:hypothetical protein